MNLDWTTLIAAAIAGGLLTKIFDYFTSRPAARIDNTTKIQAVYEKTLDDMTERYDKENLQKDKRLLELEKERDLLKARLDESRQTQGELLVKVEDMNKKVDRVGADVNQITGDFGKFPMANDRPGEPYGRRASDKPKNGE